MVVKEARTVRNVNEDFVWRVSVTLFMRVAYLTIGAIQLVDRYLKPRRKRI